MTNVDIALLTGHDLRNDNIELMRQIGDDEKATPHPQLLKLFEHYRYLLYSGINGKDNTEYKAAMAWVYKTFFEIYGEGMIYREPLYVHNGAHEPFYKRYLLEVDPLLISLSFNSIVYLWFCTEEYDLVKRIIKRLKYLSSVWQELAGELPGGAMKIRTPSGDRLIESHWIKCVPIFEVVNSRNTDFRIRKLLPSAFVQCIQDVFVAFSIFKRDYIDYGNIPSDVNWSVFVKIWLNSDPSIKGLIEILKRLDSIFFDPEFMFSGLKWTCTHQELWSLLKSDQSGYNNPILWLLLCYLNHTGQLTIDNGNITTEFRWSTSDMALGQAMFDHVVYKNTKSIMNFLNTMQYKRNRKYEENQKKSLVKLIQRYREFGLALDPKKLGIKRGVLINFLSAGYGDIFCVS